MVTNHLLEKERTKVCTQLHTNEGYRKPTITDTVIQNKSSREARLCLSLKEDLNWVGVRSVVKRVRLMEPQKEVPCEVVAEGQSPLGRDLLVVGVLVEALRASSNGQARNNWPFH